MLASFGLRKKSFELVEAAGPTLAVAVARGLVEELLVNQGEDRSRAVRLDQNGHERLALWNGAPCPGEHELLVGHHLAVDAADVMLLTVLCAELDRVVAADAHVGGSLLHPPCIWAKPLHDFFGLGP